MANRGVAPVEPDDLDWLPIWYSIMKSDSVTKELNLLSTLDMADEKIRTANLPHRIIARHGVGRRDTIYPLKKSNVGERALNQHPDVIIDTIMRIFEDISDYAFEIVAAEVIAREFGGVPQLTPKSRDGGLDGIVRFRDSSKSDILIQSKQWSKPVGTDDLDKFLLDCEIYSQDQYGPSGESTDFGMVFISLMGFTSSAQEYENSTDLILVDGNELAAMAVKNRVGIEQITIPLLDPSYWRDLGEQ